MRKHAFLSYAHQDAASADLVQAALERAGVRVWRASAEIWPGEDWLAKIRGAVTGDALAFVVLFSRASLAAGRSRHHAELVLAIDELRQRQPFVPWLIPVRLDECEIPDLEIGVGRTLRSLEPADLSGSDHAAQLARLARSVTHLLGSEQPLTEARVQPTEPAYLRQVRRIAPPGLPGREVEMAELAAFCTEPGTKSYAYWRAGAWAGKSALLSSFVLHPPPEVQVVSFFITARLAAQDTREAFVEVLLDQLAHVTGQELPAVLPESTRDAFLLDLLAQAAVQCRDSGMRLVLVVDGLDEDRGVTTGPDAHSIAGLLPADPSAGMRVIVSGRPDPPIPDDVPDWHPLRDPGIIRSLAPSPHARDIKRLARLELDQLLRGTGAEQDVLGLLTAARGGLTALDLADLAQVELWESEDILRQPRGRAFASRLSQHWPGLPTVYLLCHEELQATARRYMERRLPGYWDRLAAWAARWRDAGWPPGTPEYLLSGYFQLLIELGDVAALTALSGDAVRHDRMLDLTGGDSAALAEVRAALGLIAVHDAPDVSDALHLAWHRDQLTGRNEKIPENLPAVWAALGNTTRALALAASIPHQGRQAAALTLVAGSLASAGKHERAETIARSIIGPARQAAALALVGRSLANGGHRDRAAVIAAQAEIVARSIADPARQAVALAQVAGSLASAGRRDRAAVIAGQAEIVARSIISPDWQAAALVQVAGSLASAGHHEHAEAVAGSIADAYSQAQALALVAGGLGSAGRPEHAAAIAGQAATAARSLADPYSRAQVLVQVAESLASAGRPEHASAIAGQAAAAARSIADAYSQAQALALVAGSLASAGCHEQAEAVAGSIADAYSRAQALALVAGRLASAGRPEHASAIAGHVEAAARSLADPYSTGQALLQVAESLASAGQHGQAEAVAGSIADAYSQARALALVAGSLAGAGAGDRDRACAIAGQAETVAGSIADAYSRVRALALVAGSLAGAGDRDRACAIAGQAEAVAGSIADRYVRAQALALAAGSLASAGQYGQAETVAGSIADRYVRAQALVQVAGSMASAGQYGQAETVAGSIADPFARAQALVQVAGSLASAGQHGQASAIAGQAEAVARSIADPYSQAEALALVAGCLASTGQRERAEAVARSIDEPYSQAEALALVAGCLASAGQYDRACAVAGQAETVAGSIADPYSQAEALALVAGCLASTGQRERAEAVARSIDEPYPRARALVQVVFSLASAGELEQAGILARSITHPDSQAQALARLAMALISVDDTDAARRITVAALAAGAWHIAAAPAITLSVLAWPRIAPKR